MSLRVVTIRQFHSSIQQRHARSMINPFTALTASLLLSTAAFADTYITEFIGTASGDFAVNRIEITWSTAVAFGGNVTIGDLSDLSISAYDDNAMLIFTDTAIVEGAVQLIGSVPRDFDDLAFDAVSGMSIGNFDNDVHASQQASTGSTYTYNIYKLVDGRFRIDHFFDGSLGSNSIFSLDHQSTSAIPEPSTYAGIVGLFGLALAVGFHDRQVLPQRLIAPRK
jgi:hypothetical protein